MIKKITYVGSYETFAHIEYIDSSGKQHSIFLYATEEIERDKQAIYKN